MEIKTPPTISLAPSILICGMANGGCSPAFASEFTAIWTLNEAHGAANVKTDLIIAMDDLHRDYKADSAYVDKLLSAGVPIVTTVAYPKWPSSVAYPLKKIIDRLNLPDLIAVRLFDNSLNYAIALAMCHGAWRIGFHGCSFCPPDRAGEPDCFGEEDWGSGPYARKRPDWFKFHGKMALRARRPREPGIEACHFLLGMAMARDIALSFGPGTTLLNLDREQYYYGYEEQPEIP